MQKKYQELKEAFERVITMICRQCPDTSRQEIEKYLLSMTFRIWSCNIYYAPAYKEAIQTLLGTLYTMEQIMTVMS